MPPLARDRLVLSGAGLLVGALLLTLLLGRVGVSGSSSGTALLVLGWLVGVAQVVGAVLLGGGLVLREQARRAAPPVPLAGPQRDWYAG